MLVRLYWVLMQLALSTSMLFGARRDLVDLKFVKKDDIIQAARLPIPMSCASFSLLVNPKTVHASAQEALAILHGEQTHMNSVIVWVVLISGLYMLQYKVFRFLSSV